MFLTKEILNEQRNACRESGKLEKETVLLLQEQYRETMPGIITILPGDITNPASFSYGVELGYFLAKQGFSLAPMPEPATEVVQ